MAYVEWIYPFSKPAFNSLLAYEGGTGLGAGSFREKVGKQRKVSELRLKNAIFYLLSLCALFIAMNYSYPLFKEIRLRQQGYMNQDNMRLLTPRGKTEFVRDHIADYDVFFFGDSRTYIGVSPEVIEPVLGLRCFNFGSTAHWIQTQYPQVKDIAPLLKGKTVVWTIGHLNFRTFKEGEEEDLVNDVYPLSPKEYLLYLNLGFSNRELLTNLGMYYMDPRIVFFKKETIKASYKGKLWRNVYTSPAARKQNSAENKQWTRALNIAQKQATAERNLVFMEKLEDGARKKNVVYSVYKTTGQLEYWELDRTYLRASQEKFASSIEPFDIFQPDKRLEYLFEKILNIFKENGVNLVVVEYWDAPYHYRHASNLQAYKRYMKTVESKVLEQGFSYVKPDFSGFTDAEFFDDCHFNAPAARTYSKQLAQLLKEDILTRDTSRREAVVAEPLH